jgi:hypothetical protein
MIVSRRTLRCLIVAIGSLIATRPPAAYPITPVPLWELTQEAELVVLGDVVDVREDPGTGEMSLRDAPSASRIGGPGAVARLRVREVWKGTAAEEVGVAFTPNLICPAPPRYVTGKVVAAFLARSAEGWHTVALSYGTIYPAKDEVGDLRDRVREAVALQAAGGEIDEAGRIAWLVRAAARPATRWHGLYDLAPAGDSLHSFYDERGDTRAIGILLTDSQYEEIARGFIERPSTDRTLPMLLHLFEGRPSHALDRAAMAAVEGILAEDTLPWWVDEALERLLRRLGDPDPDGRLRPLGEPFDEKDTDAVRAIWTKAKVDLSLPEIPPVGVKPAEVRGVGPNTPS